MKVIVVVFMFFILGALFIISNNNLMMIQDKNVEMFSEMYAAWLDGLYSNVRVLTGNVVKMNWFPE